VRSLALAVTVGSMNRSLALAAFLVGCASSNPPAAQPIAPTEPSSTPAPATFAPPPSQYPPGLGVEDSKIGTGPECKKGDTCKVRYVGTLEDGTEFDSNPGATFQIGVGMLIKGWDEGIPGMRVGGVRKLTVPPALGYGANKRGKIPANSFLYFEVELLAVNP
jgi:FKBP-type peptidyl-prolyl cis-trans isomerase